MKLKNYLGLLLVILLMIPGMAMATECEHVWEETSVLKVGTCDVKGVYKETCTLCGDSQYATRYAHEYEECVLDATCTEPAMVAKVCTLCGEVLSVIEEVEGSVPLGHDLQESIVDASCENPAGIMTLCTRCDYTEFTEFAEDHELYAPAVDHAVTVVEGVPATCTNPGLTEGEMCTACGEWLEEQVVIAPDPEAHVPMITIVVREATCTTNGVAKAVCEYCAQDLGYMTYLADHTWEYGEVEPTCTMPGAVGMICVGCGLIADDAEITDPALGHQWDGDTYVHPDCDSASGLKHYCVRCDEIEFVEFEAEHESYEPALGHTVAIIKGYAPTCSEPGMTDGEECSVCGEVIMERSEIPADPDAHKVTIIEGIAPTCCTSGISDGEKCMLCGKWLVEQVVIAPDPEVHVPMITEVIIEATCTTDGIGEAACAECGADLGNVVIEASHVWVEEVLKVATCASDGLVNRYCEVCDAAEKNVVVPATGEHVWVDDIHLATCTTPCVDGEVCIVCGLIADDAEIIEPALGHKWADETYRSATCEYPAGNLLCCSECSEESFEAFDENHILYEPATGHVVLIIEAIAPTCCTSGLTESEMCEVCCKLLTEPEIIPADPDAHKAMITDVVREATCTTNGVAKAACEYCAKALGYMTYLADHTWVYGEFEPTCTMPGAIGEGCTVCGLIADDAEIIASALGHQWDGETYVQADCENANGLKYYCVRCDEIKFEALEADHELYEPALGHTVQIIKGYAATCCEPGMTDAEECSVCGKWLEDHVELPVDPDAHKVMIVEGIVPTCSASGISDGEMCELCGEWIVEQVEIAADSNAHHYEISEFVREPSCTINGIGKSVCVDCGASAGYVTITASHTWEAEIVVEPGCAWNGLMNRYCPVCDAEEWDVVIPATGEHLWEEVDNSPTCTMPGVQGRICVLCETIADDTVITGSALGHYWQDSGYVDATCELPAGVHRYCEMCGEESFKAFDETHPLYMPAKGHKVIIIEGIPATCCASGMTEGQLCEACGEMVVEPEELPVDSAAHSAVISEIIRESSCTANGMGSYICEYCEAALGDMIIPASHSWDTVDGMEATCAEDGYEVMECAVCGDTQKIILPATGMHEWYEDILREASCTRGGSVVRFCGVCDLKEAVDIPALGHEFHIEIIEYPNCGFSGLLHRNCERCIISEEIIIPPTGEHDPEDKLVSFTTDATCTENAKTGKQCPECGLLVSDIQDLGSLGTAFQALGHEWQHEYYEGATCELPAGYGYYCSRCGAREFVAICDENGNALEPALGHRIEYMADDAGCQYPTCTGEGYGYEFCYQCGTAFGEPKVLPALGHRAVYEYDTEPTCTEEGFANVLCEACGVYLGTEIVYALGHEWDMICIEEPTCSREGYGFRHCMRCEYEEEAEILPPHEPQDICMDIWEEPGCGWNGVAFRYCGKCGEGEEIIIPCTELHAWGMGYRNETCAEPAYEGQICINCSVLGNVVEVEGAEALGHEWVTMIQQDPTCSEEGYGFPYCTRCGYMDKEQIFLEPFGHEIYEELLEEATCGYDGLIYRYCGNCDEYAEKIAIQATGEHIWTEGMLDATCNNPAYYGEICVICGQIGDAEVVEGSEALGHEFEEVDHFAPTCEEPGTTVYECLRCSEAQFVVPCDDRGYPLEPANGHDTIIESREVTCIEDGLKDREICLACGMVLNEGTIIKSTGEEHIPMLVNVLKEADCYNDGLGRFECEICGKDLGYQTIPAEHAWVQMDYSEPSCTEYGYEDLICTICGIGKSTEYPPYGHEWKETDYMGPTCKEDGYVEMTCVNCGGTQQEAIAAFGHTEEVIKGTAATCTEPGVTDYIFCTVCEAVLQEHEEIEPYGHKWTVGKAPTCSSAGSRMCTNCGLMETLPSTGEHTAELVAVSKEPTCEADGVGRYACKHCGTDMGYDLIPGGHVWLEAETVQPTCVSDGYTRNICERCGDEETITIESTGEAHEFVDDGWGYSDENGTLTPVDEEYHVFSGPVDYYYICRFCEEIRTKTIETELVAEHYFKCDYETEESCICACGQKGHNSYDIVDSFTLGEAVSYQYRSEYNHIAVRQLGKTRECWNCGDIIEVEWLDATANDDPEAHTYENGICIFCGGEEAGEAECSHERTYVSGYEYISSEWIEITPEYHVQRVESREYLNCADCGKYMGTGDTVVRDSLNHHWIEIWEGEASACYACGYESECAHENLNRSLSEAGGCMLWAQWDETHHKFYGNVAYDYQCTDCNAIIYLDDEFYSLTDENGLLQEHVYNIDGVKSDTCIRCGYTAEAVLMPERELTYAIPGMEFTLPARVERTDAEVNGFIYESSDESIVTVTEDGTLLAVGRGVAEIRIWADGIAAGPAECSVYVVPAITPPAGAQEIQAEAFAGSAIRAVDLSANDGICIGEYAFADCSRLACVFLPETLEMGEGAFDPNTSAIFYCRNAQQVEEMTNMGFTAVELG